MLFIYSKYGEHVGMLPIYKSSIHRAALVFILQSCYLFYLMNEILLSLIICSGLHPLLREISGTITLLLYVHQLVANCVYLMFGAG